MTSYEDESDEFINFAVMNELNNNNETVDSNEDDVDPLIFAAITASRKDSAFKLKIEF